MSRAINLPLNPRDEWSKVWTKSARKRLKRQKAKTTRRVVRNSKSRR